MKKMLCNITFLLLFILLLITSCESKESTNIAIITENGHNYILQDSIIINTTDGAEIAVLVVRNKAIKKTLPTILHHTIYTRDNDYKRALLAASQGYVGVVSYTRGKAWSTNDIIPYEFESEDIYEVIEWVVKQPWSNGEVGMQGGSYTGFTQWAATKKMHPALKTIVPSAASSPGIGEPMEGGVYMTFLYPWFPHVTNNKLLDHKSYNDHERWNSLKQKYYQNGIAYRKLDSIDGVPNPLFNKQLKHPTYDEYWQSMMPYKEDFSNINIPILSTTGYFDGAQIGALYYLRQHYKYNKNAEHYLVIGPFGHLGSQYVPEKEISKYTIDSVAQINITRLSYQWFDYIFKNAAKPELLKDKINFQVMGANYWKHVSTLNKMSNDTLKFYLNNTPSNVKFISRYNTGNLGNSYHFSLTEEQPDHSKFIMQKVDFTDRSMEGENNYYNPDIIDSTLPLSNGFSFISEPFKQDVEFNGTYFGEFKVAINKKDMDYSIVMYEQTPEGDYFKLTQQCIGRASLSKNREKRQLLIPNHIETIPFESGRMTSKLLKKGSRLIMVLNINKHPHEQINYGTGKNVSDETIADASQTLSIKWYNNSYVKVPIYLEK